ncbi:peptidoglycan-binding protein [Arvimicrobium flavum]|uniref:peptidoglycan-binding protein n=1 Tax=Arvimicrobium flavum TaxID=3393320 RepID=UPI00237B33DF|nr:peptidoglycan-binding protein [Mesorhizobium shangrilense]
MDGRRPYLDSLNVGRQRRAHTTLDELNRSIEQLGERLERRDEFTRGARAPEPERRRLADHIGYRSLDDAARQPSQERREASASRDDAYLATTGRLSAEVRGLREELRQQMSSGLQREFDTLRADIARAYASSGGKTSGKLTEELERLTETIQHLSNRSDDRGINLLRLDIEQVKAEIDSLARDETLRAMDRRWDRLDQRWDDLEHRIDVRTTPDPDLSALNERLQHITDAVNNLPESLSLRSLEDKVRTLAGSVEHFSQQRDDRSPQLFAAIEQRLDEISRAIVASAVAAQPLPFDFEPIERIETRISALARQLDELSSRSPSVEILDRLNTLSQRIEEVAQQADVPARSVERLASQIAIIVDRIDAGSMLPDADQIMRGIEQRFDQFATALVQRQDNAFDANQAMFRDLEARLHDVVSRLDHRPEPAAVDNSGLIDAIDARLDDFTRRLETQPSTPSLDADAIRNLETQIAGLSAFLSQPDPAGSAIESISPRLEEMEKAIRGNRDTVVDAARRAAEDVVRSFGGSKTDADAVAGLTQDLKTLESITRRSDDRNSKTFEAIHDTLLKIVDRLSSIETGAAMPPAKVTIPQAPSIEPIDPPMVEAVATAPMESALADASFEEASADPVIASADGGAALPAAAKRRSMFSGLGRALSGRKTAEDQAPTPDAPKTEPIAPKLDLDEPLDPKAANRPLQPGSGAPDLSRIMKRVREERAQPAKAEETDAAKSDFIAAARRAAQAAAAEAEVLKRHSDMAGPGRGFKLGDLLKARRKPILMGAAAVMIALAGLQLGKAFMSDQPSLAKTNPAETNLAAAPVAVDETPVVAEPGRTAEAPEATTADAEPEALAESAPRPEGGIAATEFSDEALSASASPVLTGEADVPVAAEPESAASSPSGPATASVSLAAGAQPLQAEAQTAQMPAAPADVGPIALREAADAGDPKAMFEVGARHSEGRGVKTDNEKAAEWYERAAELGLAPAQYRIGNMYEKGVGVERDLAKAKTWYQMAAEQGNASAMHNLAVLYAMGADGTTDNESAARWFVKAGELGVKDSQFNLGILNAKGVGMPQNLEESYKWFALVAKSGDRDATAKRDEIANSLRPEQLEKARAATELWKAKQVDPASNVVDIPDEWTESQERTASIDMKKAVKTIQLILNKNGYDAGGADGVIGQKTKDAIIAFQKDIGLPADGQVTEQLVEELIARK